MYDKIEFRFLAHEINSHSGEQFAIAGAFLDAPEWMPAGSCESGCFSNANQYSQTLISRDD